MLLMMSPDNHFRAYVCLLLFYYILMFKVLQISTNSSYVNHCSLTFPFWCEWLPEQVICNLVQTSQANNTIRIPVETE